MSWDEGTCKAERALDCSLKQRIRLLSEMRRISLWWVSITSRLQSQLVLDFLFRLVSSASQSTVDSDYQVSTLDYWDS